MSKTVTAIKGAAFKGAITVKDAGLQGMITLRGNLKSEALANAVKTAIGVNMPEIGKINSGTKGAAAWMSSDELFLLTNYTNADAVVAKLDKALATEHMLAVNVSDARAMFHLEGAYIRDVLAKGSPANLSPAHFQIGDIRRTRLGQLPVAFWLSSQTKATVICFRSVGEHVFAWLKTAARKDTLPKFHIK